MAHQEPQTEAERVLHAEMNRLRGQLCGLIESWGLPERREEACKGVLKSLTYTSEEKLKALLNE